MSGSNSISSVSHGGKTDDSSLESEISRVRRAPSGSPASNGREVGEREASTGDKDDHSAETQKSGRIRNSLKRTPVRVTIPPRVGQIVPPETDDWVRLILAIMLFLLFAVEVSASFYVAIFRDGSSTSFSNMKSVLDIVFAPTVALFGAATGFYYGTKERNK